ncbi:hypothetical protein QA612_08910 [Evansella sp. AB-P1]|uniref:YphA family membrane protein n=1 Tax=Evansella sp. AB-P1 TaxID=3037653 RepID=UPI00241CDEDB|nr:hypothetical protein [Evansella sp. AB-P1]MDG5787615.1 hypothetical protein [Evansella sp. AB-P1]
MNGFWYYWVLWLLIIYFCFFDENNVRRKKWIYISLFLIISSYIVIPFLTVSLRISILMIAFLAFYFIAKMMIKDIIYAYVMASFVSFVFLSIKYFVYFEPIWLYISPFVMIISIIVFSVIVFVKKHINRLTITVVGIVQGELLLLILLWQKDHPSYRSFMIGDFTFLNIVSVSLLCILCWNSIETIVEMIKTKGLSRKPNIVLSQRNINT